MYTNILDYQVAVANWISDTKIVFKKPVREFSRDQYLMSE